MTLLGHTTPSATMLEVRGGRRPLRIRKSADTTWLAAVQARTHVAVSPSKGLAGAMTRHRSVAHRGLTPILLVVALAVTTSCSGRPEGAAVATSSTTTTGQSTNTTTTTADPIAAAEAEVEAAYRASSRAFIDAAALPDPNFEALAATHVGPMFEQRRGVLLALQADGRIVRYPPDSRYQIEVNEVAIDADVATVDVCVIDDGERVVVATGEVIAGGLSTVEARAAMRLVDGVWKLAERVQKAEWEGVAGCALG